MNKQEIDKLCLSTSKGESVSEDIALSILLSKADEIPEILTLANALRIRYFGNKVQLCSILNAKSGACEEDCSFCAQSAHFNTGVDIYDLHSTEKIIEYYKTASQLPINHFGVVTSGGGLSKDNLDAICGAVKSGEINGVSWCSSLGNLEKEQLLKLKEAGLKKFHHNLETAESFFPNICTTHTFRDRIEMVRRIKEAGLQICSGGIMGLGESIEQRVEFAFTLRNENVDSIPLNFHVPKPGTRLENLLPLKPLDILKCVAMFRMVNPKAEIKVCAGRVHLRDLQSMIFYAGATGMMIGPLLTIAGRDVDDDLKMLSDLELNFNHIK